MIRFQASDGEVRIIEDAMTMVGTSSGYAVAVGWKNGDWFYTDLEVRFPTCCMAKIRANRELMKRAIHG